VQVRVCSQDGPKMTLDGSRMAPGWSQMVMLCCVVHPPWVSWAGFWGAGSCGYRGEYRWILTRFVRWNVLRILTWILDLCLGTASFLISHFSGQTIVMHGPYYETNHTTRQTPLYSEA
jgi:hypothetical protein